FERVDESSTAAASPGAAPPGRRGGEPAARTGLDQDIAEELARAASPSRAPRLAQRLGDASRAYERERYDDARRILVPLAREAPGSTAVRELLGLTWYRLGRWRDSIKELEAFRSLTASTEQHPVLADAYRAVRRYDEVEALWRELREASPSAAVVAEGRIVYAGMLADRGDLEAAIKAISPSIAKVRKLHAHHLRLLYVLADLYERAGDAARARTLFDRIVGTDPAFADARARRRALG
ncbi:MAG: tetratricopeptide repeat protein, partial [Acidimicrobiales bacterium]